MKLFYNINYQQEFFYKVILKIGFHILLIFYIFEEINYLQSGI